MGESYEKGSTSKLDSPGFTAEAAPATTAGTSSNNIKKHPKHVRIAEPPPKAPKGRTTLSCWHVSLGGGGHYFLGVRFLFDVAPQSPSVVFV